MITYSIIQKSQLEGAHPLDTESWFKYIKPIYEKIKKLKSPSSDGFGLIYTIDKERHKRLENLIEKVEKNIKNFEQIFGIVNQLKDDDADDRIDDMVGELRAASYLIDYDYKEIQYQKKGLDFKCKKNQRKFLVEVKFFRGPDFKTQEKLLIGTGAYKLAYDKLLKLLGIKLQKAIRQFRRHDKQNKYEKVLIFVTNLLESEKGWHGEKVEEWCKNRSVVNQKMKIVFLTGYGDIYQ